MNNFACPICKSNAINKNLNGFDNKSVTCSRCGDFSISGTASAMWQAKNTNSTQIANACGWVREHQGVALSSNDIDFLLSVKTPSVAERANKILLGISKQNISLSDRLSISANSKAHILNYWLGISYSDSYRSLEYLFYTYLLNELHYLAFKVLDLIDGKSRYESIYITPKGYAYLDSLSRGNTTSQVGFCAMWFDESVLPTWVNAIEPAIKGAGYNSKRIDSHQHNNKIDDEIIAMIRRSKFVVADFTGQRGGVYFEAGFALGLGLQVIWTCKKSELEENKIHFDTRQYNFVIWEEGKLGEFQIALQNRIEATIGRGNFS